MNRNRWGRSVTDIDSVVVAEVNGEAVTLGPLLHRLRLEGGLDLVQAALREQVIDQALRAHSIEVTTEELQEAADMFRTNRRLFRADDTHAWLKAHHLSVDDLEEKLSRELALRKLRVLLTEDRVEPYFVEHHAAFASARLSLLRLESEEQAREVATQIEEDEADFSDLVRSLATDPGVCESGGYLGWVARKALSPAAEAAVFSASPGDTVGPIKTDGGWALIKVWEVLEPKLTEHTRHEIRQMLFGQWLAEQINQAKLKIKLNP